MSILNLSEKPYLGFFLPTVSPDDTLGFAFTLSAPSSATISCTAPQKRPDALPMDGNAIASPTKADALPMDGNVIASPTKADTLKLLIFVYFLYLLQTAQDSLKVTT